ncbi:PepSY-associated TM helix domain-containing protein [Rouxiella sp. Mn2063]|uniref:PepSY-associated TM helix domain-containing protein n=1 Tax=Rouxiella sp. Mn2063 TaxID=3395262 RepID=UPI003BE02743
MSYTSHAAPTAKNTIFTLIRRLHFYIGLFIAPFIFVAALTGTLYVLTPQIEGFIYKDVLTTEPQGNAQPLSQQIVAARHYAGEDTLIYAVRPAPSATDTTRVQFVDNKLGASESRSVFVDPYTLKIKGDLPVYGTSGILPLRTWLDGLHRELLLGDLGRNYSELAASWLWVAALGGVILWLGTRPRRKVKSQKGRFAAARHWHITLGLVLFVGLVFFSATGLTWSQWAGNNIDKMRAEFNWMTPQVNTNLQSQNAPVAIDPHAEHHGAAPIPAPAKQQDSMDGMDMSGMDMSTASTQTPAKRQNRADADWNTVLQAARAAGITASKVELRQPKAADKAWTVTEVDRGWPTQVDAVSVDPNTFAIIDHVWFAKFPLLAKLTRWGIDAHMGILFGLANQLILAAFGLGLCVMIVLGYRIWWIRRPAVAAIHPAQTLLSCWQALSIGWRGITLLIAVVLGYCLPLMGISLLIFVAIDIVRWMRNHHRVSAHQQAQDC